MRRLPTQSIATRVAAAFGLVVLMAVAPIATISTSAAAVNPSAAASRLWTGTGDGLHWSDPANWSAGSVPPPTSALVFPAGSHSTNDLLEGFDVASIDATAATLDGNAITLEHGLVTHGAVTIAFAIKVVADDNICECFGQVWHIPHGSTANITGAISVVHNSAPGGALFVTGRGTIADSSDAGALTISAFTGFMNVTGVSATFAGSYSGVAAALLQNSFAVIDDWPALTVSLDDFPTGKLHVLRRVGPLHMDSGDLVIPASATGNATPQIDGIRDGAVGFPGFDVTAPGMIRLSASSQFGRGFRIVWHNNAKKSPRTCSTDQLVAAVDAGVAVSGRLVAVPATIITGSTTLHYSIVTNAGDGNDIAVHCAVSRRPIATTTTNTPNSNGPDSTPVTPPSVGSSNGDGTLPNTGNGALASTLIGLLLVVIGSALALLARRRRYVAPDPARV